MTSEWNDCIPWHTYWITFPMFKNWFAHGIHYRAVEVCSVRSTDPSLIVRNSDILFFGYSIHVLPGIVINRLLLQWVADSWSFTPHSHFSLLQYLLAKQHSLDYINGVHMQRIYCNRFTCGFVFSLAFWQKATSAKSRKRIICANLLKSEIIAK